MTFDGANCVGEESHEWSIPGNTNTSRCGSLAHCDYTMFKRYFDDATISDVDPLDPFKYHISDDSNCQPTDSWTEIAFVSDECIPLDGAAVMFSGCNEAKQTVAIEAMGSGECDASARGTYSFCGLGTFLSGTCLL